jgi:hypothetical protein
MAMTAEDLRVYNPEDEGQDDSMFVSLLYPP